jgi:hypothetical protein
MSQGSNGAGAFGAFNAMSAAEADPETNANTIANKATFLISSPRFLSFEFGAAANAKVILLRHKIIIRQCAPR